MTVLPLVCVTDARYAIHAGALLHSIYSTQPAGSVAAHVMHPPGLGQEAERLRAVADGFGAQLTLREVADAAVGELPRVGRFPQLVWYRLLLPELFPELDRILYVDADTLAAGALAHLADLELGEHWVAAVDNVLEPRMRRRPAQLGLAPEQGYFNSGVLLFNLEQMRRDGCSRRLVEYARHATQLVWPDQDVLNAVLGPRRLRLHPRYNCQNSFYVKPWSTWAADVFGAEALAEAVTQPAIIHFEGPSLAKPWHFLSTHPWRERYRECVRATPWRQPRIVGYTPMNVLRRCGLALKQGLGRLAGSSV